MIYLNVFSGMFWNKARHAKVHLPIPSPLIVATRQSSALP